MGRKIHKDQVEGLPELENDVNTVADFEIENRNLLNQMQYITDNVTGKRYKIIISNGVLGVEEI